jgi:glycosyltransferase involved in cell wall biosynthesis
MTFEPGSGASLGDAIRSLALRPQAELNAMGECGRRAVLEHFTIEATATQLEQLLRDVVRRAS